MLLTTEKCRCEIKQHDIGIVTPYKLQAQEIKRRCDDESLNDITVGTAAILQGQEKQIIIISTVSVGSVSEFAANPRRINVMLTRAKSLLVIIGHGATLIKNKNWKSIYNHCELNGSVVSDFPFK